jgi:hypothetical protein
MSSIGAKGNRVSAIANAIRTLQTVNTGTQDQLKTFLADYANQQRALLSRLETLESTNSALRTDVQALRAELQAVRSSASASTPASLAADAPAPPSTSR